MPCQITDSLGPNWNPKIQMTNLKNIKCSEFFIVYQTTDSLGNEWNPTDAYGK